MIPINRSFRVAEMYPPIIIDSHCVDLWVMFFYSELAKVSETRSQLESLSTSLDDALARKAAVPRARSAELADAKNALTAVGTCFAHTALDYVAQINITQAHKDHIILDAVSYLLIALD